MRKTALIVGGCSGIGFGVARALAQTHDLILVYRQNEGGAETARRQILDESKAQVGLLRQPLEGADHVMELMRSLRDLRPQGVDVLVNAFGAYRDRLLLAQEEAEIARTLNEHLLIPILLSRQVVQDMYRSGFGRVLNIGSISAHYVKRGQVPYAAAKAGLEGFTRAMAMECGDRGITVNLICPGLIDTPSTREHLMRLQALDGNLRHHLAVGAWGSVQDVGGLAAYLCSESAGYITGASFTVDGGRSLGDARI